MLEQGRSGAPPLAPPPEKSDLNQPVSHTLGSISIYNTYV